jgi:hypothetical protein
MGGNAQGVPNARDTQIAENAAVKLVTAAATLASYERVVAVTAPASSTYAVTLPPVASCPGAEFLIYCTGTAGTGTVSVACQQDGLANFAAGKVLDSAKDYICARNLAGKVWVLVAAVGT